MHFYCVPAFSACISIASGGFLDCSRLPLGCSTFWEAFWTALDCFWAAQRSGRLSGLLRAASGLLWAVPGLYGLLWAALGVMHTQKVLEHSRNACTQCWNTVENAPYCIPALCACISTMLQHLFLCAFLLYSSTVCMHFYYAQALSVCISTFKLG